MQTQAGINSAAGTTTVNGQRSTYVNVTLDGINVQDNFIRTNDVDFLPNLLLLDQVSEVTVVSSNASAVDIGGSSQIQFMTPSGTNQFHGAAIGRTATAISPPIPGSTTSPAPSARS